MAWPALAGKRLPWGKVTGKSIGEVWDTHWTRVGELRHSGVGEGTRQRLSNGVLRRGGTDGGWRWLRVVL
jgi:hypothetical protein